MATGIKPALLGHTYYMEAVLDVNTIDIADLSGVALRKALVERASLLQPLLEKNAARTEADRRVVEENIVAMRSAGLLKITIPRRFGGLETDLRTMVEVSRELGKGCGSTAWVASLHNSGSRILGIGPAAVQKDVWGDGLDANVGLFGTSPGVSTSRKVSGGLIVSGKWAFASGCLHASWGLLGVPLVNDAGEKIGQALGVFPASDFTIEDTWHAAGMKGSGSNTIVVNEIFIPEHRLLSTAALAGPDTPTAYKEEALYRSSLFPSFAIPLLGPLLGMASRALEYVIEKASQKGIALTSYQPQATSTGFQASLGKAAVLIETAHLHTYRAADTVDEAAREGRTISFPERAKFRMDAAHAAEAVGKAIELLMYAHGASSFLEQNPLQRIWRDVAIASRHAILLPEIGAEIYGRSLLGVEEKIAIFV